jgi:predicted Zn-dependent protease
MRRSSVSASSSVAAAFAVASAFILLTGLAGKGQTLVSIEEEIEIGRSANEQMRKQVPELRDTTVTRYVRNVGKRLAQRAPGARYPYSFCGDRT